MRPCAAPSFALILVTATLTSTWAQGASIYTCTDAQGRRLTSDRIIPQCLDREQYELNPSGTVRRVIPPSLTAEERTRAEARQRAEAEARNREAEERRRNQAMLIRFPNEETHQRAREDALKQVNAVIAAVVTREGDLEKQRQEILAEMEFYQRDPSRAPAWLQHRQTTNQQQIASQRTFREDQEREISRINQRFDEELALLQRLWRDRDASASR